MKKTSRISLLLGALTVVAGYIIIITNLVGLHKSKKIEKMMD